MTLSTREIQELTESIRDFLLDVEGPMLPRETMFRYEQVLSVQDIETDGSDLLITTEDGTRVRYVPEIQE
jgi:hypothetical protein